MHIHACMCIYICVCMYVNVCVYTYIYIYTYVYIYIYSIKGYKWVNYASRHAKKSVGATFEKSGDPSWMLGSRTLDTH